MLQGDDLAVVLFFVSLAIMLGVTALHISGWRPRLVVGALLTLCAISLLLAGGWVGIKTYAPILASVMEDLGKSPVSWFVIFMFGLFRLTRGGGTAPPNFRQPEDQPRQIVAVEFDQSKPGFRVETELTNGEKALYFRVQVQNQTDLSFSAEALVVDVRRKDMNGDFRPTEFVERVNLVWSARGPFGPNRYEPLHPKLPLFLDVLYVTDRGRIAMATPHEFWPNSAKGILNATGVLLFEIRIINIGDGRSHSEKFIFQWPGNWKNASMEMVEV